MCMNPASMALFLASSALALSASIFPLLSFHPLVSSAAFSFSVISSINVSTHYSSSLLFFFLYLSWIRENLSLTDLWETLNSRSRELFRASAIVDQAFPLSTLPFLNLKGSETRISLARITSCLSVHSMGALDTFGQLVRSASTYDQLHSFGYKVGYS